MNNMQPLTSLYRETCSNTSDLHVRRQAFGNREKLSASMFIGTASIAAAVSVLMAAPEPTMASPQVASESAGRQVQVVQTSRTTLFLGQNEEYLPVSYVRTAVRRQGCYRSVGYRSCGYRNPGNCYRAVYAGDYGNVSRDYRDDDDRSRCGSSGCYSGDYGISCSTPNSCSSTTEIKQKPSSEPKPGKSYTHYGGQLW